MTRSNQQNMDDATGFLGNVAQSLNRRKWKYGAFAAVALTAYNSVFSINPSDRGNVRRLGTVEYAQPLQPGPHLKLPFIDRVDTLQTSLTTDDIGNIDVGTVDNQRATIDVNFVYNIPDSAVNHLLYSTGSSGDGGIQDQVEKTVRSVTVDVFAQQNMNSVNANLESIRLQLQAQVSSQLSSLYGVALQNIQIESVRPSDEFLQSNEQAVKSKNAAIAAENQLKTVEFIAEQTVATAKGAAESQIEQARGQAEAVTLAAAAERTRLQMEGQGQQALLQSEIKAFGGNPQTYISYLQAKAALNWNGSVPSVMTGAGNGPNLVLPLSLPQGRGFFTLPSPVAPGTPATGPNG